MEYYANRNSCGYMTMAIIVDNTAKTVKYYGACQMPVSKYKKVSKAHINDLFKVYETMGYRVILTV